jgi:hypothetical protein
MSATGSDNGSTVPNPDGEQPDGQVRFLREQVDDNATIAYDITDVASNIWAVHGAIPVDGEVIMAEFETYDQAKVALDGVSDDEGQLAPPDS